MRWLRRWGCVSNRRDDADSPRSAEGRVVFLVHAAVELRHELFSANKMPYDNQRIVYRAFIEWEFVITINGRGQPHCRLADL